jgi:hypothetical protein
VPEPTQLPEPVPAEPAAARPQLCPTCTGRACPHGRPFLTRLRDDVRSEIWSVHIGRQLGLDPHEVEQRVQEGVRASNQRVSAPIGSPTKDVFDPDSV